MMSIVVTSFSVAGARLYGVRMVASVLRYWPPSTIVAVYPDQPVGILGQLVGDRYGFKTCEERLTSDLQDWMACKRRWAKDPAVQGRPATLPKGKTYHYRYDAARFAVKHFVMRDAALRMGKGLLTWLDGDTATIARIPEGWPATLLDGADVAYLGRGSMHPETGYVGFRIPEALPLLDWCCETYSSDRFRDLPGWTDCHVLRAGLAAVPVHARDLTSHRYAGRSHIWPLSPLAPYVTHFKGRSKRDALQKRQAVAC